MDIENLASLRAEVAELRSLVAALIAPPQIEFGRLALESDGILVVRIAIPATPEIAQRARRHFSQILGDVRVLVIDDKTELSVLTKGQLERLLEAG